MNQFSIFDVRKVLNYFGDIKITNKGNIIIPVSSTKDTRKNTVQYAFYIDNDGIKLRRMITLPEDKPRYYQMFRNSRKNEWIPFNTFDEAFDKFINYLDNIA